MVDAEDGAAALALARRMTWTAQLARHARRIPDEVALRWEGRSISWRELDGRTSRLAAGLARRGVARGDRVLVLMVNRPEFLEGVLAISRLGAIAVPVNFRLTVEEVDHIAGDSGAGFVLTDEALAPLARKVRDGVLVAGPEWEAVLAEDGDPAPVVDVPESEPALIMYTSGTTGRPKGAVLTHLNLLSQAITAMQVVNAAAASEVAAVTAPLFHVAGIGVLLPVLLVGSRAVLLPSGGFDAGRLLDVLEAEGVTSVFMVPTQWQQVCAEQAARPRRLALRTLSWGAAPASDTLLRRMAEVFPGAENVAVFGQTEMSPVTCALPTADALRKLGSVGRPVPGVEVRVVDPAMRDVPPGEVGEIVYRGSGLMAGYWRDERATTAAFAGGWFHSGDLVRVDEEGFVYVVDRVKDMIISGGENIYCAEVENALAAHPDVVEVAVIGRADPVWGETPVAVVATRDGRRLDAADLEEFLGDRLARYKRPREVVVVDALPRNASGKVVKPLLRERYGS